MVEELNQERYDELLDALDNENIELLKTLFAKYNLTPETQLFDIQRIGPNDEIIQTYIDYVIVFSLTDILDYLIDNTLITVDDLFMAKCLEFKNTDLFEYICELGYMPQENSFKTAIKNSYSAITYKILTLDNELITIIDDKILDSVFGYVIDEETVETISVLFEFGVNKQLFAKYLTLFKNPEIFNLELSEEEENITFEIINILENNGVLELDLENLHILD